MTTTQIATYRTALKEARTAFDQATTRLSQITAESRTLNDEIGKLRRTITALAAMCSESPGFDKFGITEVCMDVMEMLQHTLTTAEVVDWLDVMGFDLKSQKNVAASVHAVLSRLAEKGKITKVAGATDAEAISWRGPNYDPDFDQKIPF